jgi:hypothetical protein
MIAQFKKIKQTVGKININPRPPPFLKIEFSFQAVLRSGQEGPPGKLPFPPKILRHFRRGRG